MQVFIIVASLTLLAVLGIFAAMCDYCSEYSKQHVVLTYSKPKILVTFIVGYVTICVVSVKLYLEVFGGGT